MSSRHTLSLIALLGAAAMLGACERPPVVSTQIGYRGVAMEQIDNPRLVAERSSLNEMPAPQPPAPAEGPRASQVYENVQVLGDLSVAEFTRVMLAMTQWVAPAEQSCNYCHAPGASLAADDLYRKKVSRQMLRMVREVNSKWTNHVGQTGVTCYTCHRGREVPQFVWFHESESDKASKYAGFKNGQNAPAPIVGLSSLPNDPLTPYLDSTSDIRIVSNTPLPNGSRKSIKQAEETYGLMMHLSQSLGVNCTFCHNSRSFSDWDASTPKRVLGWYAIRMARELNGQYLEPITDLFPPERLGPHGDVAKVSCATCHQGVSKPMNGAQMLADYPELRGPRAVAPAPPVPPAASTPRADGPPLADAR